MWGGGRCLGGEGGMGIVGIITDGRMDGGPMFLSHLTSFLCLCFCLCLLVCLSVCLSVPLSFSFAISVCLCLCLPQGYNLILTYRILSIIEHFPYFQIFPCILFFGFILQGRKHIE